jgi:aerobic-type carbon monoxide dehydrogenase small subunit (CoxS/CutS family)
MTWELHSNAERISSVMAANAGTHFVQCSGCTCTIVCTVEWMLYEAFSLAIRYS